LTNQAYFGIVQGDACSLIKMRIINIQGDALSNIAGNWYFHDKKSPSVLMLHSNVENVLTDKIAEMFFEENFNILSVDVPHMSAPEITAKASKILNKKDMHKDSLVAAMSCWDWLRNRATDNEDYWIIGINRGAWIAMQLLMRRPEISSFICIDPLAHIHDFSFLAPCPCPGLMLKTHNLSHSEEHASEHTTKIKELSQKLSSHDSLVVVFDECSYQDNQHIDSITQSMKKYIETRRNFVNAPRPTKDTN
jgi:hypothetical protein